MRTKKEGWRSTACSPTSPAQAAAALTTVSRSPRAMRSRLRLSSFPPISFPFTDQPETDPVTGEIGGLLDRAVADKVVPRIFFSNTSYRILGTGGRPDSRERRRQTRRADLGQCPHLPLHRFTTFLRPVSAGRRERGILLGQEPQSPLPIKYFWRAMIANMDAWVRSDTPPPPSSYPRIADGNLVPFATTPCRRSPE